MHGASLWGQRKWFLTFSCKNDEELSAKKRISMGAVYII